MLGCSAPVLSLYLTNVEKEFKLSKMPVFYLAFVFLQLQPLTLKSRASDERAFDNSRVSTSQQQKRPDRPQFFCNQMGTVEWPLGQSHK